MAFISFLKEKAWAFNCKCDLYLMYEHLLSLAQENLQEVDMNLFQT